MGSNPGYLLKSFLLYFLQSCNNFLYENTYSLFIFCIRKTVKDLRKLVITFPIIQQSNIFQILVTIFKKCYKINSQTLALNLQTFLFLKLTFSSFLKMEKMFLTANFFKEVFSENSAFMYG